MNREIMKRMNDLLCNEHSKLYEDWNKVEKYINQLESQLLEMSEGYIDLAEDGDYDSGTYNEAKQIIKELKE